MKTKGVIANVNIYILSTNSYISHHLVNTSDQQQHTANSQ